MQIDILFCGSSLLEYPHHPTHALSHNNHNVVFESHSGMIYTVPLFHPLGIDSSPLPYAGHRTPFGPPLFLSVLESLNTSSSSYSPRYSTADARIHRPLCHEFNMTTTQLCHPGPTFPAHDHTIPLLSPPRCATNQSLTEISFCDILSTMFGDDHHPK